MEQADRWITALQFKGLNTREIDVARLLVSGMSEKEIAKSLETSTHTVHGYVKKIYRCEGVHSRAELLVRIFSNAENPQ